MHHNLYFIQLWECMCLYMHATKENKEKKKKKKKKKKKD